MRELKSLFRSPLMFCVTLLLAGSISIQAQEPMTIQATVTGTSTQMGKMYDVTIYIEKFSTPTDQKALIDAFSRDGQEGLRHALEHMNSKGRVRFSMGGVGNDVKHIIELPSESGRRLRLVTDRNLSFAELRRGSRSKDYDVGVIELQLTPDGKKGTGTVLPACSITLNKKTNQIEVETFQNPWKLDNFTIHNGK